MFYKSGDRTSNGAGSNALGENSQMFFDASCRIIPKVHLYGTVFIDEVNVGQILKSKTQTNLMSFKGGVRVTNLIKNTSFTLEYTRTNPWVYVHPISTTTFASNNYTLGHYLGQNAQEVYCGLKIKPIRGLAIDISYTQAIKGPVREFAQINGVNNVAGTPFMENILYMRNTAAIKAYYEIVNDVFVFGEGSYSDVSGIISNNYTPDFYQGKTKTITLGMNVGF
jgi:hypothetical protein